MTRQEKASPPSGGYALVTPARNEAEYLPGVIESVLNQTLRPIKWVIVNDSSTDLTEEIARDAAGKHSFMEVVSSDGGSGRSFGSKVAAFNIGYERLKGVAYDYIGNLDADVTFQPTYYADIIKKMGEFAQLGVASGVVMDKKDSGYERTVSNLNHAVGAVQLWRRSCFVDVGGYKAVTLGGVDTLAERTARQRGWKTRSFEELKVYHHKPVDIAKGKTAWRIAYRAGATDYYMGTGMTMAFLKAARRWRERPRVFSIVLRTWGYTKLWATGTRRDASDELVRYLRKEEWIALRRFLLGNREVAFGEGRVDPTGR